MILKKWYKASRGDWCYRTESLTIFVHGHIDHPPDAKFVSTNPDIGFGNLPLPAVLSENDKRKLALEIVTQQCLKLYEDLIK